MASDLIDHQSPPGIPTLYEIEEGTSTATYPHKISQFASRMFQRTCINVRIGYPDAGINHPTHGDFVQHHEPFDADGTLNISCRMILIAYVQDEVRRCKFPIRECIVWSPTSCSYVETDGSIFEVACGEGLPAGIAFEAARLALISDKYPQFYIEHSSGAIRINYPDNASQNELVAQAVEIVMKTERRARVVWSESETIAADPVSWHTNLVLKYPHIVVRGRIGCILFYPNVMTMEELIAKALEITAKGTAGVRVVLSLTEGIWVRPPRQEVYAKGVAKEGGKHESDHDPEYEYYERVVGVIKRQEELGVEDLYSTILAMGASDLAYLQASISLIKTGYKMGTDPFLIGMMHFTAITDALEEGKDIVEYSILYLRSVEQNLLGHKLDDLPAKDDAKSGRKQSARQQSKFNMKIIFLYCISLLLVTSLVGAYLIRIGHWFIAVVAVAVVFKSGEALADFIFDNSK